MDRQRRPVEVAFVLQVYGLVPILSARENVSIALRARGVAPADADEEAEAALARFSIADLGERQVEELSGGQMQRVACARGFVVGADVLLADEPTSELDEGNRGVVLAEPREEAARAPSSSSPPTTPRSSMPVTSTSRSTRAASCGDRVLRGAWSRRAP